MHAWTGICIPPTAMPLEDNDHTHVHTHLPSVCESALQIISLTHAAAALSSMEESIA